MQRAVLRALFLLTTLPVVLLADDLDNRLRADDVSFAPREGGKTQIRQLIGLLEQAVQQNDIALLADVLAEDIYSTEVESLPAPTAVALQEKFAVSANAVLTIPNVIPGWDLTGFRNFDFTIDSIQIADEEATAWLLARWPHVATWSGDS
jgi:hypothetical protein